MAVPAGTTLVRPWICTSYLPMPTLDGMVAVAATVPSAAAVTVPSETPAGFEAETRWIAAVGVVNPEPVTWRLEPGRTLDVLTATGAVLSALRRNGKFQ